MECSGSVGVQPHLRHALLRSYRETVSGGGEEAEEAEHLFARFTLNTTFNETTLKPRSLAPMPFSSLIYISHNEKFPIQYHYGRP
jgi:hypothetical protein